MNDLQKNLDKQLAKELRPVIWTGAAFSAAMLLAILICYLAR